MLLLSSGKCSMNEESAGHELSFPSHSAGARERLIRARDRPCLEFLVFFLRGQHGAAAWREKNAKPEVGSYYVQGKGKKNAAGVLR